MFNYDSREGVEEDREGVAEERGGVEEDREGVAEEREGAGEDVEDDVLQEEMEEDQNNEVEEGNKAKVKRGRTLLALINKMREIGRAHV